MSCRQSSKVSRDRCRNAKGRTIKLQGLFHAFAMTNGINQLTDHSKRRTWMRQEYLKTRGPLQWAFVISAVINATKPTKSNLKFPIKRHERPQTCSRILNLVAQGVDHGGVKGISAQMRRACSKLHGKSPRIQTPRSRRYRLKGLPQFIIPPCVFLKKSALSFST